MALSVIEKVILLQNVDVFATIPTDALAHIAAIAEEMSCLEGDDIYAVGDEGNALYLVIDGCVRLHRNGEAITESATGDSFGTWALFDTEPRVATATALADTRLLRVDREDFLEVLSDHSDVVQGILKSVVGRVRGLLGRVGSKPPSGGSST